LIEAPLSFEATAPPCVEIVQIDKPDEKRILISAVNIQDEIGLPRIPVEGIVLRVRAKPRRILLLPAMTDLSFDQGGEDVIIKLPDLETLQMIALDCK